MTRDDLLDALCAAPPGQFDRIVAKLAVPAAYLSSAQAAQATRAAELLRWVEHRGRLADLERALHPAATPGPVSRLAPRRVWLLPVGAMVLVAITFVRWTQLRHPPDIMPLIWPPSDCENKAPRVGYGSCSETRDLPWLQSQINGLSNARVQGFEGLGPDPTLIPSSNDPQPNWFLYLEPGRGGRFIVGVGYNGDTRAKDGCLHIYDTHNRRFHAATACLDKDGSWWASDGWLGTYRRIHVD